MKRFAKIILGALAALVILIAIPLVGVNLYLQSGDVQQRIRLATEQALGMPVTVNRTVYTPWGGLTLSGLSLPDPTIPGEKLVDAPKFSVKFQFWPLLARKLVISQVSLSSPHLVLRQTKDRKWVLVPPRPAAPSTPKPSGTAAASGIHAPAYTVELRYFYIHDAAVDIIDRRGAVLGRVRGMTIDGNVLQDRRIQGSVWIDDIDVADLVHPNRLRADFVQSGDQLTISDLKFAVADGKVRGEVQFAVPPHGKPSFDLKGEISDVSLPTLLAEAHGDSSGVSGTLLGDFNLRGDPTDSSSLAGGGNMSLSSAQLRPFDVVQQLGVLLGVEELQLLKLSEASLRFDVRDEKFWMNDLRLKTENLIITTKGPIKFNGKMNLEGRFLINEKIERQLSMIIGDQFAPSAEPGYKEVGFTVTGRTSHPETDLPYKVTGFRIGNLNGIGSLLKGFFQGPKPSPQQQDSTDKAAASK